MQKMFSAIESFRSELPDILRNSSKKLLEHAPDQDTIPAMIVFAVLSKALEGTAWMIENGPEKIQSLIESGQDRASEIKNTIDAMRNIKPFNLHSELRQTIASFQQDKKYEARLIEQNDSYSYRSWCLDFQDRRLLVNISNPGGSLRISLHNGVRTSHTEDETIGKSSDLMFDNQTYTTHILDVKGIEINPRTSLPKKIIVSKIENNPGPSGKIETMKPGEWVKSLKSIMPDELVSRLTIFK